MRNSWISHIAINCFHKMHEAQLSQIGISESKGTWKEGAGRGSKKIGRCANIVEVCPIGKDPLHFNFLVHDADEEQLHELPAVQFVIIAGSAAADLVRCQQPLRVGHQ